MISRAEGYRRSKGKEEPALRCVEDFFAALGVPLVRIDEELENRRLGDLKSAAGRTIECKGQPIDPIRYPRNFVEVFEVTNSQKHGQGFPRLAALLGMSQEQLAQVRVDDKRWSAWPKHEVLGAPPSVSVSIQSIASSELTVYINAANGGVHLYVYDSGDLMELIREAVRAEGLKRGMGKSNVDTFAVLVRLPPFRWSRENGAWSYGGDGEELDAVANLRARLVCAV